MTTIRTAETLELIASRTSPCRLLEIGCGDGELAAALAARGFEVVGIDLDSEAVAAAVARGVDARCVDVVRLEPAPFDAVVFTRSLHHVSDPRAALRRARECVAPGGYLLIEELGRERVTGAAAAWWADLRTFASRLCGLDAAYDPAPLRSWHEEHPEDHIRSGEALSQVVAELLPGAEAATAPYLYRYVVDALPEAERERLGALVLEWERALIARGLMPAVGLRWAWVAP